MARFRVLIASPWVAKYAVGEVFESEADYIWIQSCLERKIIEYEWTVEQIEKKKHEKLDPPEHGWAWYEVIKSCDWIDHEVGERFRANVNGRFIRESIALKVIKMVLPSRLKPFKVPARPLPRTRKPKHAKKTQQERKEARRLREEERDRDREEKRLADATRRKSRIDRHWKSYSVLCDAQRQVSNYEDPQIHRTPHITRKTDPWNWRGAGNGSYVPSAGKIGFGPLYRPYYGPSYEGEEVGYGSLYDACYYNTYEA